MKRKIKIGRTVYKVKRVDKIRTHTKRSKKQKGEVIGLIKPRLKTILVKKKGKIIDHETLMHEIAHGYCIEMVRASCDAYSRAKKRSRKAEFKEYANIFCSLNQDEGFIDYFGRLLNKTFKLR